MTYNPIFLEDAKGKLRIVNLMFQVKFEDQIRVRKFELFQLYIIYYHHPILSMRQIDY